MTDDEVTEMLGVAKAADVKIIQTGVIAFQPRGRGPQALRLGQESRYHRDLSEPEPKALPMIDSWPGEYEHQSGHSRSPEAEPLLGPEFTYDLIKDLKTLGFCADVGHWKRSGLEPVAVLEKYGEKVFSLHFKTR